MYTPTQLAKMFNTTRTTIYNKFKNKKIEEYLIKTEKGNLLDVAGLNQFKLLMSESKVNTKIVKDTCKDDTILNDSYIENLKQQINNLNKDKEYLLKDKENLIQDKNKLMNDLDKKSSIIENQLMLIKENQSQILLLAEPKKDKKKWWNFWKN